MGYREQMAVENDKALRLAAALMRLDTQAGDASSVSVNVSLRRSMKGGSRFTVKMGEAKGAAPSLGGALLDALDKVGLN